MHELIRVAGVVGALSLPVAASAVTAMWVGSRALRRSDAVDEHAGAWLTRKLADTDIRCGVAGELAGDVDAFWPHSRFVTLAADTWRGRDARSRAVAAHELGHALVHDDAPARTAVLHRARRLGAFAGQAAAGLAVVGALYGMSGAWLAAGVLLAAQVVLGLATPVEEALASRCALGVLDRDPDTPPDVVRLARGAMIGAFAVYAAEWLATLGLLATWPLLRPLFVGGVQLSVDPNLVFWAVLLLAPVLLLRAGHVVWCMARPPRPTTDLRLAWTSQVEATWDFHAAVVVALWAVLAALHPFGRVVAPLVALAAIPAMAPLSGLGRGLLLLPLALVWLGARRLGLVAEAPVSRAPVAVLPRRVDALSLAVFETDLLTRAGGLVRVAYIPLLTALVVHGLTA